MHEVDSEIPVNSLQPFRDAALPFAGKVSRLPRQAWRASRPLCSLARRGSRSSTPVAPLWSFRSRCSPHRPSPALSPYPSLRTLARQIVDLDEAQAKARAAARGGRASRSESIGDLTGAMRRRSEGSMMITRTGNLEERRPEDVTHPNAPFPRGGPGTYRPVAEPGSVVGRCTTMARGSRRSMAMAPSTSPGLSRVNSTP